MNQPLGQFVVQEGFLFKGSRLCISRSSLRDKQLRELHSFGLSGHVRLLPLLHRIVPNAQPGRQDGNKSVRQASEAIDVSVNRFLSLVLIHNEVTDAITGGLFTETSTVPE